MPILAGLFMPYPGIPIFVNFILNGRTSSTFTVRLSLATFIIAYETALIAFKVFVFLFLITAEATTV